MPISLPCPTCNATLKAPDAAAGLTLQCPGCLKPVPIPARPQMTPPPRTPPTSVQNLPSKAAAKKPPEEKKVYQDLEVVEEHLDDLEEVQPVPDDEEGVETLEEVDDAEDLEEVVPATAGDLLDDSRLLAEREIYIHARKYDLADKLIDRDLRDYELCRSDGGKVLGRGREVRDMGTQAIRVLVGRLLAPKRLEISEGRDGDLLGTVRRSPMPLGIQRTLDICDGYDRVIGRFEMNTFTALARQPLWISSPSGKKILQMKPQPSRWRYLFLTPAEQPVAELVYAHQGIRIHWGTRDASSYYLRYRKSLDGRPRDKLLCLAVALGLEA